MAETKSSSEIMPNNISLDLSNIRIDSEEEDSSELDFQRSGFPANTNINVESSSDVVIGSVTQFHGPVTIYQNTANNTQVEKTILNQDNNNLTKESKLVATESFGVKPISNFSESRITKKTFILGVIFIIIIFICVSVILGLFIRDTLKEDASSDSTTEKHQFIPRSTWGGRPPLYTRKIHQPTKYVIIAHTAGNYCQTIEACSKIVVQAQSQHVAELNSPDVGYNFLVGADENVYIGRGWDAENFMMSNSISIAFMGNYIYDRVTPGMIEVTQELLNSGLKQGKLDQNFTLIAHNQTWNTLSPGSNLYNVIKFWPHYSPELVPIE